MGSVSRDSSAHHHTWASLWDRQTQGWDPAMPGSFKCPEVTGQQAARTAITWPRLLTPQMCY